MQNLVEVYWSFRSPYSYLVMPDLLRLRDDYDVAVALRPVLPIALRDKGKVFDAGDPRRAKYIVMDSRRRAEFLGMAYHWPKPDPVVQTYPDYEVAKHQPYIWRLTGLGIEAERRGKGIDLAFHVSHLIWSGVRDWDQGDLLAQAVAKAGLDLAEIEGAMDPEAIKAQIEANHAALDESGHWGVPCMVFENEPFFGQDRIDTLRWRLDQAGLHKKSS